MLTTLSHDRVVAELGYTVRLIRDRTGELPLRFWWPPYGNSDARVPAIAEELFGLVTIIWNRNTADWSIITGATTVVTVKKSLQGWLHGLKPPGLIVFEDEVRVPPSCALRPQLTRALDAPGAVRADVHGQLLGRARAGLEGFPCDPARSSS
jgi:hypothetical protein